MNLHLQTASQLAKLLASKECSSKEVTADFLAHIKQIEPEIGAFITVDVDGALEKAQQVDELRAKGEPLGPLAGIPIGLKDNINTKGQLTTCASKMLANYRSPYDATVTKKIKDQQMIILGKLNMDEFAIGTSGENSYFRPTTNPWNKNFTPGGSSSGSAASVAASQLALSLGTDTGGSVRVPSAFCGVVGLKPTYGAISRYGVTAAASSLDQVGLLGKSVEDVSLLFDAIAGYDPKDATSTNDPIEKTFSNLNRGVKGLKIGLPKQYFDSSLISAEVLTAVTNATKELERQGATLIEIDIPSAEHALAAYYVISSAEISSNLARFDGVRYGYRAENYTDWDDLFVKTRSQGFGAEVQRRIMLGTFVLSIEQYETHYRRAKDWQVRLIEEFTAALKQCDLLVTPTTKSTAFGVGEGISNPPATYGMDYMTAPANLAGLPAVSIPCGVGENNLPIGLQLIGSSFAEATLLSAAHFLEQIQGGFDRPTLFGGDPQ